ncbi:hypothetical protein Tco_0221824 [Tanacetum coccineum]
MLGLGRGTLMTYSKHTKPSVLGHHHYHLGLLDPSLAVMGPKLTTFCIGLRPGRTQQKENIEEKVDEVLKPYELASDEWYYEIELEIFNNWKAEEEEEVNNQRSLQLSRDHEEQLAFMSRYNLFEDNSCEDEAYYTNEDDFES